MKGSHGVVLGLLSPLAAQATDQPASLPEAACREVLAALDRAFESGDASAYFDRFAPARHGLPAAPRRAIDRRLAQPPPPRRKSELLAPPRCVGPRTVLMVGTTTTAADGTVLRERSYLALRPPLP